MKADLYQVEKSELVYEILTYLAEHPDSNDTLEGIVQWWLLERRIEYAIAKVKDALAELVAQGLVFENEGKDSRVHYRINRRKQREIRLLLNEESG